MVEMLERHGVKPTANRIVVLRALAQAGRPLTLTELEYQILTIDKSGVFRALMLFKEHHLVHTIDDAGGGTRYELCRSHSEEEDDDLHVHFFCEQCHRTYCLDNTPVPPVELPDGFRPVSVNYIVKGVCHSCSKGLNSNG